METKEIMRYTDGNGREVVREINYTIDIRDHKRTPGFALLFVAANTHLSVSDLCRWLRGQGPHHERGRNWLDRRRWLFQPSDVSNPGMSNRDGRDAEALAIMREYSTDSLRFVVARLKERGIKRGKDWVRRNRCQ
jgi:hypothetical protein